MIENAKAGLRPDVALVGGFAVPTGGDGVILLQPATSGFVVFAKGKLRIRVARSRPFLKRGPSSGGLG